MMFTNHSLSVLEITIVSEAELMSISEMFWRSVSISEMFWGSVSISEMFRSVSKLGLPFVMVCSMYSMIEWVAKFMLCNIGSSSVWSNFMMRN